MISVFKSVKYASFKSVILSDVRNFARAITGDRLKPLNKDTLTGRFLVYLDNKKSSEDVSNVDKFDLISVLKRKPLEIKNYDTASVITVLQNLHNKEIIRNKHEFYQLLNIIDTECCKRHTNIDVDVMFNLLHSFMVSIPHRITECSYFHLALEDLVCQRQRLTKNQLIQLVFFVGLLKKSGMAQDMLRKCIKLMNKEYIDDLTKEDLCIICNSTFKTSTKINNRILLDKLKLYMNDNLILLKDPAVFVTLIKTLRHNRYQDEDILATITCTMFFNKTLQYYSFSAMCHILALYADYLYYDENILEVFSKRCLEQLEKNTYQSKDAYLEKQARTKDIKRFLWALSNLNYKLSKNDIESKIIPEILNRIKVGEFKNDPCILIDILLYLWMMQYRANDLIKDVLKKENVQFIRAHNPANQKSLNLLLTCIYYEDKELFNSLKIQQQKSNKYNINAQLQKRPVLKKITENLKQVSMINDIDKFDIGCQVPYINIVGITGFQKKIYKTVHIEVLDEYTCLKNTDSLPTGLMQLKLRLLDKSDEGLVVIQTSDITDCSDSELQDILREEVSLVC